MTIDRNTMEPYAEVRKDMRRKVVDAKEMRDLTFADIEEETGIDKTYIASAVYDGASTTEEEAIAIAEAVGLGGEEDVLEGLQIPPMKGQEDPSIPSDPALYRFYEVPQVYGPAMKAIMHEEFGDGIMSAIDFDMHISRVEHPKGDRVKVEMSGKFLAYSSW
jgi:cyanate lyase